MGTPKNREEMAVANACDEVNKILAVLWKDHPKKELNLKSVRAFIGFCDQSTDKNVAKLLQDSL